MLNPELAFTLPAFQVACGSADIMSHLMERYFTNSRNVAFIDRLLEATMKTVIAQAPKVLAKPTDYDAWSELMWAGTIAHNNLLNTGRVGDWGSHDIEHEISGIYDVAHGAGLAVVFPAWMKHVLDHDLDRFVQWSVRVWNVELDIFDKEATARAGIARLEAFFHSIGLGTTLASLERRDRPHRRDGEEGHRRRHAPHRQFRQARLRPGGEGPEARGLRRRATLRVFDASRSSFAPASAPAAGGGETFQDRLDGGALSSTPSGFGAAQTGAGGRRRIRPVSTPVGVWPPGPAEVLAGAVYRPDKSNGFAGTEAGDAGGP